jgi:hypothetical protein
MIDLLKDLGSALIPPLNNDDREAIVKWRILVALGLFVSISVMTLHVAWSGGWWPGESGFAKASEVKKVRVVQLEGRLEAAYAALCDNPGDIQLLNYIRTLQTEYQEVTNDRYPAPDCNLLQKLRR